MRSIHTQDTALRDIREAATWYRLQAGKPVSMGFTRALEKALTLLAEQPDMGSLRFAEEAEIPGLRVWNLRSWSHSILYRNDPECLTILRVLHTSRDLGVLLK